MPTVQQVAARVDTIIQDLTIINNQISESYDSLTNGATNNTTFIESQIDQANSSADMYDRKFQEKEAELQATGGKTRRQTLQEYVLLFFFCSYFILAISNALYITSVEGAEKGIRGFIIYTLLIFPIAALMIKFL